MANETPDGGGGQEYSGEYVTIDSYPDSELLGATNTRDVQVSVLQALPSNVVFSLRFTPEVFRSGVADSLKRQFAGYFNAMAQIPNVTGISTFQDINDADQIQDVMRIVVRSTSGITSFAIEEHQFGRNLDLIAEEVAAVVKTLNAGEKGG